MRSVSSSFPRVCLFSSYVASNPQVELNSKFVRYCRQYRANPDSNGSLLCEGCLLGLIPTEDWRKCVDPINNCLVAKSDVSTNCKTCVPGFLPINGLCKKKEIAHCKTFSTSTSQLQCDACFSGYVLNTGKTTCTLGLIRNCDIYEVGFPEKCTTCLPRFVLYKDKNSYPYCYSIDAATNCLSLKADGADGFSSGIFNCQQCA